MKFNINMAATHPRWPLKCEFDTFFDGVLFVSGMIMYRDVYFVYLGQDCSGQKRGTRKLELVKGREGGGGVFSGIIHI